MGISLRLYAPKRTGDGGGSVVADRDDRDAWENSDERCRGEGGVRSGRRER